MSRVEEGIVKRTIVWTTAAVLVWLAFGIARQRTDAIASSAPFPDPALDNPLAAAPTEESVVLAGGCFWGVQAVFQHLKGVTSATSGYSGGAAKNAKYELVSMGTTGHAESVRVVYDASKVSLGQVLKIFFRVAHDPTELNRQGPDEGTQYRSAIFYAGDRQRQVAEAYVAQLGEAKAFKRRIVTQIVPLDAFYAAEDYHQDYAARHPFEPYIMINDRPKVDSLRSLYPAIYVEPRRK
jgi:peptide-methionine (S)-S-oxide reductase